MKVRRYASLRWWVFVFEPTPKKKAAGRAPKAALENKIKRPHSIRLAYRRQAGGIELDAVLLVHLIMLGIAAGLLVAELMP